MSQIKDFFIYTFIMFGIIAGMYGSYMFGKIENNTYVAENYSMIARMTHQYNCQKIVDFMFQNSNMKMSKPQMMMSARCNQEANIIGKLVELNFDKIQDTGGGDLPMIMDEILTNEKVDRSPANILSRPPMFPPDFNEGEDTEHVSNLESTYI